MNKENIRDYTEKHIGYFVVYYFAANCAFTDVFRT
jgi:hypothetical protein